MSSSWLRRTVLSIALLSFTSCKTWVLVESEYRGTSLGEPPPQAGDYTFERPGDEALLAAHMVAQRDDIAV